MGELEYAKTGAFDITVVNDDLDRAYKVLEDVTVHDAKSGDALPDYSS